MSTLRRILKSAALSPLEPDAAPFRMDPSEAREAFLLLHGFTGIPRELAEMGRGLAEAGYACYAPRYPGHGTGRRDFLASGAGDWMRRAADACLELSASYRTVHVLGHSMGGLIAAAIAAAFGARRLILLAPAFRLSNRAVRFAPALSLFIPVLRRRRPLPDTETDLVRRRLYADYWADDLISGAAQLERIRRTAAACLPEVRARTLVIVGGADETVPPSVANYLRKAMKGVESFDARSIPGAGHRFPFDTHAEAAAGIVRDWILGG